MVSARYSNIAGAMPSNQRALPRLAAKVDCVSGGLADISQETAEELRRVMMEQCHQIIQKLMPLMDVTAPRDVLDGILKVQQQQMKLAGMLQGAGISLSVGKPGTGDSEEDIIVRIKADAPVLRPDEPVPVNP